MNRSFPTQAAVLLLSLTAGSLTTIVTAHAAEVKPPKLPKVTALSALPASLTLRDGRDARSLIVTGKTAAGYAVDLSPLAKITPAVPIVRIDEDGIITPLRAGKTTLVISAAGQRTEVPITVQSVASPPVSFVRDVMPILSKTGCNAGTCHGSAKGKNGFKLSLRGYDSLYDYHALVNDIGGRRFNRAAPDQSLMLLKPVGEVAHKGGVLFNRDSRYYRTLTQWIAEGVKNDSGVVKRVSKLEILPAVPNTTLPGMTQKTLIIAHYPDGTTRDVTREAVFTSSVTDVATTTPRGMLTAVRRGESSLLVRYEGVYAARGITVLGDRSGFQWAAAPEFNYIDQLVDKKLQKFKALPSGLCDDATFLRRISIDLTGLPPAPDQVRAFLADKTPTREKRIAMVDKLLNSPEYVDRWTNKWADLLNVNSKFLGDRGVSKFRNWIHHAVASNMPYDKFVRELVTASGDAYETASANYFRINRSTEMATENVTQLFLGVRFSCNKCHDHPFEKWTMNQYYQFGAFFARVGYKAGAASGDESVFSKNDGEVTHPKTNLAVAPAVPIGKMPKTASLTSDRRTGFADWLTSADNPFFSRAMVNRLWSYLLGKGIIDPVDDIRASNPPSNPELLETLNADFVKSGFDMKHILRTIVLSRVYQSALQTNRWNADDTVNFSHATPRRLEAEQLFDSLNLATGTSARFAGLPEGTRATQLPDAAVAGGDGFLGLFGRPPRESPCECERSSNVSLGQALNLINGPTISDAIANPNGRLANFLKTNPTDEKLAEEIFLAALCRMPSSRERANALAHFKQAGSREEGAQDLMWALLNSPAFLFNR